MTQLTAQEVLTQIQAKQSLQQAELSGIHLEKSCLDQGDFAEAYCDEPSFPLPLAEGPASREQR